jgi:hypothetical protein
VIWRGPARGQRAQSRILLAVDVIHDGDPEVLGRHLAVEIEALVEAWGHDVGDGVTVDAVVGVRPGDELSQRLPTIGGRR